MGLRGPVWGNVAKALGAGVVGATLLVLVSALGARAATVDHVSIASASVTEGNAGTVNIAFTLSYTGPSNNLSVGWATSDGTATAGVDYVAASGTASFSASGPKSKTITVQVMGDLLDEANEAFTVTLSNAQPAATVDITTASRSGTINDNDPTPTIAIGDVSLPEGNSGTTMATFTLTLSTPSGRSVGVRATTANGTASQPGDYTSTAATLAFPQGTTSLTFSVRVVGDALDEADETLFVNLTSPSNVSIADTRGVATILDDDDSIPTLRIGDASRTEGNTTTATMSFTITLSPVSGRSVTVGYATADLTAAAPADYTAVSGTVTFSAGTTTRTIGVPVVGDITDEYDETLSVTLTTPVNATILDDQAIGTIGDNDAAPAVSIGNITVSEGDEGRAAGTLTVSLAAASGKPVSVAYSTADREARASADYVPTTGTLGFAPGQTTATLNVEVGGDTLDEGDETFAVALSSLVNAVSGVATGIATIVDDDPMPVVSVGDVLVAEGDVGSATAAFTVSLSTASGRLVSVDYATTGLTADGADLPGTSGSVAFSPGQTTRTVNVVISSDRMYESDETFAFSLSDLVNVAPAAVDAIGTIGNDDPVPQLGIDDRHVTEGDSVTTVAMFAISLTNPSAFAVSVEVATADGSAWAPDDYGATSTTVEFAAGETSKAWAVDVTADTVDEVDETFTVGLSNPSGATVMDDLGVATILDDDAPDEEGDDITGTWALIQVSGQDQLQSKSDVIHDALADFDTRGLSIRVPWNVLDDSLMDAGKAIADTEGKAFSIRFMAGRHTPQAVFDAGSPSYVVDGEQIPTPFYPDGSPNTVFESFYEDEVAHLAAYSRSHGIHLLHLPWYGQDWAELSNGAEVRAQPGYSEAAFIEAHRRLIDIAMRYAGEDLTVEFPMSGAGPLATIAEALTEHVIWAAGMGSPRIYVQANGLDAAGDWGAPTPAVEAQMDQAVFAQPVLRGEQMRQPDDYDWAAVYANLVANGADYLEVYVNSFLGVNAAQLADQIAAFDLYVGN